MHSYNQHISFNMDCQGRLKLFSNCNQLRSSFHCVFFISCMFLFIYVIINIIVIIIIFTIITVIIQLSAKNVLISSSRVDDIQCVYFRQSEWKSDRESGLMVKRIKKEPCFTVLDHPRSVFVYSFLNFIPSSVGHNFHLILVTQLNLSLKKCPKVKNCLTRRVAHVYRKIKERFHKSCQLELRSCVKVEVAILGSLSLTVLMVSVDIKQHWTKCRDFRAQELCESRGDHPGLPVPNSPYGLCGRKATLN